MKDFLIQQRKLDVQGGSLIPAVNTKRLLISVLCNMWKLEKQVHASLTAKIQNGKGGDGHGATVQLWGAAPWSSVNALEGP